MKKIIALLVFTITSSIVFGQIHDPVTWKTSIEKISGSEYDLIATATIDSGWHLYSQTVPENGPRPTVFVFEGNKNYLKKGNTKEGKGQTVKDIFFEVPIKHFSDEAVFRQRIRLKSKEKFTLNATVEFMVCDDTRCLPPKEVDLFFEIK